MSVAIVSSAASTTRDPYHHAAHEVKQSLGPHAEFGLLYVDGGVERWAYCSARLAFPVSSWDPEVGDLVTVLERLADGSTREFEARVARIEQLPRRFEDNGPVRVVLLRRCAYDDAL